MSNKIKYTRSLVSEAETSAGLVEVYKIVYPDIGTKYDVVVDGVVTQPNHDVDGAIRALTHMLHSEGYKAINQVVSLLKPGCV
jgi:hypothetical protein